MIRGGCGKRSADARRELDAWAVNRVVPNAYPAHSAGLPALAANGVAPNAYPAHSAGHPAAQ